MTPTKFREACKHLAEKEPDQFWIFEEGGQMNLIEGLQKEANRRRGILPHYEAVGPAGMFGATMLRLDIQRAEAAIAGGDIVQMVTVYKGLSEAEVK